MKRTILFLIAAVAVASVLVVAGCGSAAPSGRTGGGTTPSNTVAVSLVNTSFSPANIEVAVGGSVTFTNNDSVPHDVVGEGWDSGQLAAGASFTQKFDTAGTFAIHCSIHPSMTATVVVK